MVREWRVARVPRRASTGHTAGGKSLLESAHAIVARKKAPRMQGTIKRLASRPYLQS
jgi:hypothetical protein